MNEISKRVIAYHDMLDMIRIRKLIEAPVEALKEDLRISRTTADIIYKKLRDEDNPETSLIEKKGRQTKIKGEKGYFLGVSIGSQHTRVALIDLSFDCVPLKTLEDRYPSLREIKKIDFFLDDETDDTSYAFRPLTTDASRFETIRHVVSGIVRLFLELAKADRMDFPLMGIGFAVAGPVDYETAVWRSAPNIEPKIRDITLSDLLGHELLHGIEELGLFLSLDNNAKAAAISEYQYLLEQSGGQYTEDVALLYIGSGVGSAAVIDQKLLRGSQNLSGELGHVRMSAENNSTLEACLINDDDYRRYIPLVLNTINCILGIDRFILVGHSIRNNDRLIPELMDRRIQFTVPSTQQYCKPQTGRGAASTAAIGAAIECYFSMCAYDLLSDNGRKINLGNEISWNTISRS